MSDFIRALSKWFFQRGDPTTAAVLRIAFAGLYLLMLWDFYPAMRLLFGHGGLFGTLEPFPFELSGWRYFLFHHDTPLELEMWFWTSLGITICALVGFATRLTLPLMYISIILFQERGPFMTFGADLVMKCVGIWLLFLNTGKVWSLDCLLWRSKTRSTSEIDMWPVKAIQVQVALIYLVGAILKLHTAPWQDGSAVYYAVQVGNVMKGHTATWLLPYRAALGFLNYATLIIELFMPLMLFYRPLRLWGVILGFLFHTGIDLLMSIRFFSLVMFVGYLSFIDSADWRRWRYFWRNLRTPKGQAGQVVSLESS